MGLMFDCDTKKNTSSSTGQRHSKRWKTKNNTKNIILCPQDERKYDNASFNSIKLFFRSPSVLKQLLDVGVWAWPPPHFVHTSQSLLVTPNLTQPSFVDPDQWRIQDL